METARVWRAFIHLFLYALLPGHREILRLEQHSCTNSNLVQNLIWQKGSWSHKNFVIFPRTPRDIPQALYLLAPRSHCKHCFILLLTGKQLSSGSTSKISYYLGETIQRDNSCKRKCGHQSSVRMSNRKKYFVKKHVACDTDTIQPNTVHFGIRG